jgi:hypothetical protein
MKKMMFLVLGLSMMSFGCAEQPGKKKDDKKTGAKNPAAAKKDAKIKADAKKDANKAEANKADAKKSG